MRTKIFLSHKRSDKDTVMEFKKTLELIGYSTWIDEDALKAGAELEREIQEGMQESCAVVFFLTRSFKDDGYLRAEINYAIEEKRKRNAFSIITLRFGGKNQKPLPVVPKLLQSYVWKTPTTQLEALREIIQALPDTARETFAGLEGRPSETIKGIENLLESSGNLKTESEMVAWMNRAYVFVHGLDLPGEGLFGRSRPEEVIDFTIRNIPNTGEDPVPNGEKVATIVGVLQGLRDKLHKSRA